MPPLTNPELVTLGETMVLFLAEQSGSLREAATFRRLIAGAEANVAIGGSRLGRTAGRGRNVCRRPQLVPRT